MLDAFSVGRSVWVAMCPVALHQAPLAAHRQGHGASSAPSPPTSTSDMCVCVCVTVNEWVVVSASMTCVLVCGCVFLHTGKGKLISEKIEGKLRDINI